ncbi:hypothetical protein BDK51DRAFT_40863 [Blyttiomyces helicus]|uniref:Uncharacterized protein n=1 Tax=Blyttiomyces helicus TaxID=388810 RepID=A0A4P9VW66_9FUNG|nr:hypothetical protein BDK51DRAFT_40863 [Blyttiomyces helicus]|eukprot:RKO82913.1 hypothetical protein BDK51DRAFT_40863 [Blyttiomyces helicus]
MTLTYPPFSASVEFLYDWNSGGCVSARAVLVFTTTVLRDLDEEIKPTPARLTLSLRLGESWQIAMFPPRLEERRWRCGRDYHLIRPLAAAGNNSGAIEQAADGDEQLRSVPPLPAEVLRALMQSTRMMRSATDAPSCSPAAASARSGTTQHASDALLREPDRRLPPIRHLYLDRHSYPLPSILVFRIALPMFANLHALVFKTSFSTSISLRCGTIATILGACARLVAFVWRHENTPSDLLLEDQQWATITESVKKLVLFRFDSASITGSDESNRRIGLRLNRAVGPTIRQWAVTGQEALYSRVTGAYPNLEYLGIQGWHRLDPTVQAGFFARFVQRKIASSRTGSFWERSFHSCRRRYVAIFRLSFSGHFLPLFARTKDTTPSSGSMALVVIMADATAHVRSSHPSPDVF